MHRPPPRFAILLALTVVLNLVGLVMVLSASSVEALHDYGSSWRFFNRQAVWCTLGFAVLLIGQRVDYHRWRRFVVWLLLASLALLVVVLVPGVGITVNGSTSWIGTDTVAMQPAELAKLALLLFGADLLARRADRMHEPAVTLRPLLFVLCVACALLMAQPDLGTAIVLAAIVLGVLYLAGTPLVPLTVTTIGLSAVALFFALSEDYRRARFTGFLDPSADPLNTGWQTLQSLVGLASGGLSGVGLGASRSKWGFLPEAHTDFIFTIIGEELGFVGCVLVLVLFMTFGVLGVRTALAAPDRFGMLVAGGVTVWILVQAVINIGAAAGLLPITGLPLPFVSSGGSSLLVTMAATAMLLNIARQGRPAPARTSRRPSRRERAGRAGRSSR